MIIEKLVIKTGSACSLKCEKCGEFNPYLSEKGKTYNIPASILVSDICKLCQTVEKIKMVHVAGGEALLHNDLNYFIEFIAKQDNIEKIEIISNGTVIPDEEMMNVLCKYISKVKVLISDYSSAGVNNFNTIDAFAQCGINYKVMKDMIWFDKSDTSRKALNDEELEQTAKKCSSFKLDTYFTLTDGIINAHCPTAGSLLYYLDLYDECVDAYADIRKLEVSELKEALYKLNSSRSLPMCRYCIPSCDAPKCEAGKQIYI
ncbi:MAG: hypothetical protein PUE12_15285 [Oscillospiraceae bacterium]|nr:hypothetical protein [Oscillospiraceae bacterium]